jgi:nuclear RNA export factor
LAKAPFTYPVDVQGGFVENELVQGFVMQFCAK